MENGKRVEKYIQEHTRNAVNHITEKFPWISVCDAQKAVEIAREEIYKWLEENAVNFVGLADNEHPAIGDTKAFYGTKSLIHYLRQTMKYE